MAAAEPEDETAGDPADCADISGRTGVHVLADQGECQLIGIRLADEFSAGVQHALNDRGARLMNRAFAQLDRVTASRRIAGNIENILDSEREPGQRPVLRVRDIGGLIRHERTHVITDCCHTNALTKSRWPSMPAECRPFNANIFYTDQSMGSDPRNRLAMRSLIPLSNTVVKTLTFPSS